MGARRERSFTLSRKEQTSRWPRRIDRNATVLDGHDQPIASLFAAGETTEGVLGERYIGGGNSIANAVVFGRIAGRSAARAAGRSN